MPYRDCSICLEPCKKPAQLNLLCDCKYTVHYRCYKKWWDQEKNCILCRKHANKPVYNYRKIHKQCKKLVKPKPKTTIRLIYSRSDVYTAFRNQFKHLEYENNRHYRYVCVEITLIAILSIFIGKLFVLFWYF